MNFVQRCHPEADKDEEYTQLLRFLAKIEPDIPVYHTRAMRREFKEELSKLKVDLPSHALRYIYSRLTGDASSELQSEEIDDRVRLAIESDDPDLIVDLRHLNQGRPSDTFQLFFDELVKYVEEITAADERRHGIAHMSEFLSIRDMIEQVILMFNLINNSSSLMFKSDIGCSLITFCHFAIFRIPLIHVC